MKINMFIEGVITSCIDQSCVFELFAVTISFDIGTIGDHTLCFTSTDPSEFRNVLVTVKSSMKLLLLPIPN